MRNTEPLALPHMRAPRWLVETVLAVSVLLPAFAPFLPTELTPTGVVGWGAVCATVVLLPLRRRRPVSTLVALLILFTGAALAGQVLPGTGFAVAVAVFHIANRTSRRTSLLVGGATIVVMVASGIVVAIVHGLDARIFQFIVTIAFASAAGDATRSRREYIIAMTERAERAEQTREAEAQRRVAEERLKIARDLHDTVAHQISVISLNAGVASSSLETRPERARDALVAIRHASRTVLGEIGNLLRYLRAEEGALSALPDAPQPSLGQLAELVDGFTRTGLAVTTRIEGELGGVTGIVDFVAYRAIQEGLTNAHKHGAEHRAHLLVECGDDTLTIVISNPVVQVSPERSESTGSGHGLLGLRERVALVRGQVDTAVVPGGHRLTVRLPIGATGGQEASR